MPIHTINLEPSPRATQRQRTAILTSRCVPSSSSDQLPIINNLTETRAFGVNATLDDEIDSPEDVETAMGGYTAASLTRLLRAMKKHDNTFSISKGKKPDKLARVLDFNNKYPEKFLSIWNQYKIAKSAEEMKKKTKFQVQLDEREPILVDHVQSPPRGGRPIQYFIPRTSSPKYIFNALFSDEVKEYILRKMNERRERRYQNRIALRQAVLNKNINGYSNKKKKWRKKYVNNLHEEIPVEISNSSDTHREIGIQTIHSNAPLPANHSYTSTYIPYDEDEQQQTPISISSTPPMQDVGCQSYLHFSCKDLEYPRNFPEYKWEEQEKYEYRGRPRSATCDISYLKNRDVYLQRFNEDFTEKQLDAFLSCVIASGSVFAHSQAKLWKKPDVDNPSGNDFFHSRMRKHIYAEMMACIDFDKDQLFDLLRKSFQRVWIPTKIMAIDESMAKCCGRRNPDHIHIPRKPSPNGTELKTLCDAKQYYWDFIIVKRTHSDPRAKTDIIVQRTTAPKLNRKTDCPKAPTKHVFQYVEDVIDNVPPNRIIIGDSWFSGLPLLELLVSKGHEYIGICRSDRKREFFADFLHVEAKKGKLNKFGFISGSAKISRETMSDNGKKFGYFFEGEKEIFIYSMHKKKRLISTEDMESYDRHVAAAEHKSGEYVNIVSTINDNTNEYSRCILRNGENEGYLGRAALSHAPLAYKTYATNMGFVDDANNRLSEGIYQYRLNRYRVSLFMWLLFAGCHNANVIYNHYHPYDTMAHNDFLVKIAKDLCPIRKIPEANTPGSHQLEHVRKSRHNCKLCYRYETKNGKKRQHRTQYRCKTCGWMCKQSYTKHHLKYRNEINN